MLPLLTAPLAWAGKAIGLGGLVGGAVQLDKNLFGGAITNLVGGTFGHIIEGIGKPQQAAIKNVEQFTWGKQIDNWGKTLATFLDGTPLEGIASWLRNKGQDIMGVPPMQRQFGTASNQHFDPAAAGLRPARVASIDALETMQTPSPSVGPRVLNIVNPLGEPLRNEMARFAGPQGGPTLATPSPISAPSVALEI